MSKADKIKKKQKKKRDKAVKKNLKKINKKMETLLSFLAVTVCLGVVVKEVLEEKRTVGDI